MPNFGLPIVCGPILRPATWTRHWKNSVGGNAVLAVFQRRRRPWRSGADDDRSGFSTSQRQIHSARPERGERSVLASDQVFIVSSAGPGHARRLSISDDRATIVDEHVQLLTLGDSPELVVIQVYITNAYRAYRIADHYRSQGAFVCLGGLHVTSLPGEAAVHADAIFLGPGEQTFPNFLRDFRAGKPERVYTSAAGRTLERVPPVRRDLIRRGSYLVPNSIVVTRGCPQHCDFCYKDAFFQGGRGFYTQRVEDALAEIERLPGRHLYFLDDHLLGDRRFAEAALHRHDGDEAVISGRCNGGFHFAR